MNVYAIQFTDRRCSFYVAEVSVGPMMTPDGVDRSLRNICRGWNIEELEGPQSPYCLTASGQADTTASTPIAHCHIVASD